MKKITALLSIIILSLLVVGCTQKYEVVEPVIGEEKGVEVDVPAEENTVPNLENYETLTIKEINKDIEITIEYPEFTYVPIDNILSEEIELIFENQKNLADETIELMEGEIFEGIGVLHLFMMTFEEPVITDDFISIHFEQYLSMGGSNGMYENYTFNYDLKEDNVITIGHVIREYDTDLEKISELVAQKLIHDEAYEMYRNDTISDAYIDDVYEETEPTIDNYSSFTMDEEGITFYKQYYSLFPNAAGLVPVTISWNELEDKRESEETAHTPNLNDGSTYENNEYNFAVSIPDTWKGKYTVNKGNWNLTAKASYDFQFVHDGKEISNIFSINIYDKGTDVGPEEIIDDEDIYIITYTTPMELPLEMYEDGSLSHLQDEFLHMVYEDVPQIAASFTFN